MQLKNNRFIIRVNAKVKNIGPLHIGTSDEGVLIEKNTNKPYLPATGIAGAFKAYIKQNEGEKCAERAFGSQDKSSRIFVYDSFGDNNSIEIRPGLKIDYETGSNKNGGKFDREYAGAGNTFLLRFDIHAQDEKEKTEVSNMLYNCLKALDKGHISFGGFKTSGGGQFELIQTEKLEYDLNNGDSLMRYLANSGEHEDITEKIKEIKINDEFAEFHLSCDFAAPILVKGQSTYDSSRPDSENIRNAENKYIIPGSSIKGVLRSHCKKILNYLDKDSLLEKAFGNESEDRDNKIQGRVYSEDVVIDDSNNKKNEENIYYRIKLDKFTGGVLNGALVKEQAAGGKIDVDIKFKASKDENVNEAIIGLLSLALRDMAQGDIPLGSGSSIGRGWMNFKDMTLNYKGKKTYIDLLHKKIENKEFIDKMVNSLNIYEG